MGRALVPRVNISTILNELVLFEDLVLIFLSIIHNKCYRLALSMGIYPTNRFMYLCKPLFLKACCRAKPAIILLLIFIMLAHAPVQSQSIGNWTFNNTLVGTPGIFNTVSTIDFSGSVPVHSFNGGTEYFGENGWPMASANTSMYLQFSLTPLPGYQIDISSIVLRIRRSNTGSPAGAGPTSWSLRSSLDGFTADIAAGTMTYNYANYTVTPGAGFLQLYVPVTFRLYGYNTSINPGGTSRLVVDNITVTGLGYLLPVKQIALNAAIRGQEIILDYRVYNAEKNNRYFIERSIDALHFSAVHSMEEADNAAEKEYSWADTGTAGALLYYRVLAVNTVGARAYSPVVPVKIKTPSAFRAFVHDSRLYITGNFPETATYPVGVYTTACQLLAQFNIRAVAGYNSISTPLTGSLPSILVIRMSGGHGYASSVLSIR